MTTRTVPHTVSQSPCECDLCAAESGPQDTPATQRRQGSARSGGTLSSPVTESMSSSVHLHRRQGLWVCMPSRGTWDTQARPRVRVPPGSSRHHGLSQHTEGGLGRAHVYLQSSVGTSPELPGGGECPLLRPRPVSSHPGPPLLGLGKDFHSSRGGTRETGVLGSCPSPPGVSQVFSSRVLRRRPRAVAGWGPTVPPGLVLCQRLAGGVWMEAPWGRGGRQRAPTRTRVTPKERAEAGLARR